MYHKILAVVCLVALHIVCNASVHAAELGQYVQMKAGAYFAPTESFDPGTGIQVRCYGSGKFKSDGIKHDGACIYGGFSWNY